jgi:hypothetical protein
MSKSDPANADRTRDHPWRVAPWRGRCEQADPGGQNRSADRAPQTLRENYLIFKIFASHEIFVFKTRM